MKLTGRTILITGGTSGIGLELAKQLIAQRNTVLITGRDAQRLAAAKAKLPLHTYTCDAGNPADIEQLQKAIALDFPTLDTLINNAGIMRNLDLNQPHDLTDVTREVAVNLCGPVQMVQAFLPRLKTRPDALIVNVSSGLAFVPFPLSPIYSAAKAGIHAYTRCLRAQLVRCNVRVVELAPPGTETPLFRGEFEKEMKGQKGMDVHSLVRKAISGIESGKTEVRPGLSNVPIHFKPNRSADSVRADGKHAAHCRLGSQPFECGHRSCCKRQPRSSNVMYHSESREKGTYSDV